MTAKKQFSSKCAVYFFTLICSGIFSPAHAQTTPQSCTDLVQRTIVAYTQFRAEHEENNVVLQQVGATIFRDIQNSAPRIRHVQTLLRQLNQLEAQYLVARVPGAFERTSSARAALAQRIQNELSTAYSSEILSIAHAQGGYLGEHATDYHFYLSTGSASGAHDTAASVGQRNSILAYRNVNYSTVRLMAPLPQQFNEQMFLSIDLLNNRYDAQSYIAYVPGSNGQIHLHPDYPTWGGPSSTATAVESMCNNVAGSIQDAVRSLSCNGEINRIMNCHLPVEAAVAPTPVGSGQNISPEQNGISAPAS